MPARSSSSSSPSETAHYRDNLTLRRGPRSGWRCGRSATTSRASRTVTADPYEGEALAEGIGDVVETVPMPPEIAGRLGAFVEAHPRRAPLRQAQARPRRSGGDGRARAGRGRGREDERMSDDDFLVALVAPQAGGAPREAARTADAAPQAGEAAAEPAAARRRRRGPRSRPEEIARCRSLDELTRRDRPLRLPARGRAGGAEERRAAADVVARSGDPRLSSAMRATTPRTGTCRAACRATAALLPADDVDAMLRQVFGDRSRRLPADGAQSGVEASRVRDREAPPGRRRPAARRSRRRHPPTGAGARQPRPGRSDDPKGQAPTMNLRPPSRPRVAAAPQLTGAADAPRTCGDVAGALSQFELLKTSLH